MNAKLYIILYILLMIAGLNAAAISNPFAQEKGSPYGNYRRGDVDGSYGEKRPVSTIAEASKALGEYFSKRDLKVGEIREKQLFFEADILDKEGNLIDKVIVDKRTGRLRSIY